MIAMSAWLVPVLVFALSADENCAFGEVEAQVLAKVEVLPLHATLPCKIQALSDTAGRSYIDIRDAESALLLTPQGLSVERLSVRLLKSRVASGQRLALIGSGLDDQDTAELCAQHVLNDYVVVVKGGARAWRTQVLHAELDEEVDATEALQSIRRGRAQLLQIAPSLAERNKSRARDTADNFSSLSPIFAAEVNRHLIAAQSKRPVVVLSGQAISPLPRNWFLVRGGAQALAHAIEFARITNNQSGALKRPCFYP